jgi:hypothetical protein
MVACLGVVASDSLTHSAALSVVIFWRGGRAVEGAALEMLFRGNSNEGSNPSLSAKFESVAFHPGFSSPPSAGFFMPLVPQSSIAFRPHPR